MVNSLEGEDGLAITEKDLTAGNKLVWKYRGVTVKSSEFKVQCV